MDRDHFVLSGTPVPLKPGERHCYHCSGYGYLPRPKSESGSRAIRCSQCSGVGKSSN